MKRSIALTLAALAVAGLFVTLTARAPMAGTGPLLANRFTVEIDGIVQTTFREVSGLSCTTDVVEYRDGNDPTIIHLLPGSSRCGPVVLKGGLTENTELWNWYQATLNGNVQRKNAAVIVLTPAGVEKARYLLSNAWPMKYTVGPFDATTSSVAIEELDLAVERIDRA